METQPYTNREMDMKFGEIKDILSGQNEDLTEIKKQTTTTNGKVGEAFKQIADTKSDIASNWKAIQVGTALFVLVVIPLCGVIYYNLTNQVKNLQNAVIKLQSK